MCENVCKKLEECNSNSWLVCSWIKFGEIPETVCCNVKEFTFQQPSVMHIRPYCGSRAHNYRIFKRIVSGLSTEVGEFPWMASIFRFKQFLCGAAIISNSFILTAAHCFLPLFDESVYSVKIGSNKFEDGEELFISEIIIHDLFFPPASYNDIALVKLKARINFDHKISSVCLPNKEMTSDNLIGIKATVIGFGDTSFRGQFSHILKKISIPVIESEICEKLYKDFDKSKLPLGIQSSVMCAGIKQDNQDSCQGDSGGPLTVAFNEIHFIVGITSYGYKCGKQGFPGIYTNVAHYRSWILRAIVKNS